MEINELKSMTDGELKELAAKIVEELSSRKKTFSVGVKFDGYNARRYTKPWIAKIIAWPVGKSPELQFGGYLGNDNGGSTEIEAAEGDIIRGGQRDGRGGHTTSNWYVVNSNGELVKIDQVEARKLYKGN